VVKHLDDACLSNAASLEILHSIFSGKVNGFDLGNWVGNKVSFLASLCLGSLLKEVYLVSNKNFDGNLASSLALSDPLFDPLEAGSFGHIKQVDDSC
jgi:hypothetical protein